MPHDQLAVFKIADDEESRFQIITRDSQFRNPVMNMLDPMTEDEARKFLADIGLPDDEIDGRIQFAIENPR